MPSWIKIFFFRCPKTWHFIKERKVKSLSCVWLLLCPWDTMDHNLPGSSVQGIFQARVLEWVAISFSRGSSQPSDRTRVSSIVGRRFTIWATREAISPSLMFLILVKFNKPWTNELKTPLCCVLNSWHLFLGMSGGGRQRELRYPQY